MILYGNYGNTYTKIIRKLLNKSFEDQHPLLTDYIDAHSTDRATTESTRLNIYMIISTRLHSCSSEW